MTTLLSSPAVALVTGSGRNIGREIALTLAASGAAVAVNVRSSVSEGQRVVDEIVAQGGQALLCVADVTDHAAVTRMMDQISQRWGRLDVLVNNAAVRHEAALSDVLPQDWRATLAVILDGAFFCSQAALPLRGQCQDRRYDRSHWRCQSGACRHCKGRVGGNDTSAGTRAVARGNHCQLHFAGDDKHRARRQ